MSVDSAIGEGGGKAAEGGHDGEEGGEGRLERVGQGESGDEAAR